LEENSWPTLHPWIRTCEQRWHALSSCSMPNGRGYGRAGNDRMVVLDYRGPTIPVEDALKPDAFFVLREREAILDHPGPSLGGRRP